MKINEQIKALREDAGLTQKELSELCGIAQPSLARYEAGAVDIGFSKLKTILDTLNYKITFLKEKTMNNKIRENIAKAIINKNYSSETQQKLDIISNHIDQDWKLYGEHQVKSIAPEGYAISDHDYDKFIEEYCIDEDFAEAFGEEFEQDLIEMFDY